MTKLELTKAVTNIVVGMGTTRITGQIIKNNTNPETVTDVVTMTASSFVIGAAVADASKVYTNSKIDEMAAWWKQNITKS